MPRVPQFQSTRPVRSATPRGWPWIDPLKVSIHAPREERDWPLGLALITRPVSIHAPREERDKYGD